MKSKIHHYGRLVVCLTLACASNACLGQSVEPAGQEAKADGHVRFATFNIALHDRTAGAVAKKLAGGKWSNAKQIAELIQLIRPDVLLLNEFDYQEDNAGLESFLKEYLAVGQNGNKPINYPHVFTATVNTGIPSGFDLNEDRRIGTADDALGYGRHPGQYGMVVLSKQKINLEETRTFQKFLWKDMPGALLPIDGASRQSYYGPEVLDIFPLSSKSHWDIPIQLEDRVVHLLASHPTPPVFDGDEDRNGRRNHDEIRLWSDYVSGNADYLYDDRGVRGGLSKTEAFVIAGDLNADPLDGDSHPNAIDQLLKNPLVRADFIPASTGGAYWANQQGGVNSKHLGNPLHDTGDFSDQRVGNMRIDYVLPSRDLEVAASGVLWPKPGEPGAEAVIASDHRMVWIDIQK